MDTPKKLDRKRKEKGIWVKEYTLWTKPQISVLAYLSKHNNKPSTYREITRAYVKSNYTDYKRACDRLVEKGYLKKLKEGSFKVKQNIWKDIRKGTERVERALPYFNHFLRELNKRVKIA